MARTGRPPLMAKEDRQALVFEQAEKLFCERGYANVRMVDIATSASMSKKTLYVLFSDKEDLLKALIASSMEFPAEDLPDTSDDPIKDLRARMRMIARHVLSERHINLCRLAVGEGIGIEGLSQTFHNVGMSRSRDVLIEAISAVPQAQRRLSLPPQILSGMLFGASCGYRLVSCLMNVAHPDIAEVERTIDQVIDEIFLTDTPEEPTVGPQT